MNTYESIWVETHPAYIEAEKRCADADRAAELARNAAERARRYSSAVMQVLREQYRAAYPPGQQEAIDESMFLRDAQSAIAEYGLKPTRPGEERP